MPLNPALPANFDHEVRLFPLAEYVAFPHNVMPLHIFESRYREMFEDAIEGDQLIAMATLLPGHDGEYFSRPPIAPTVCIGKVLTHEQTEQGTYAFLLTGIARASVLHEIEPVRSFRRARVALIEEESVDPQRDPDRVSKRLFMMVKGIFPAAEKLLDEVNRGGISIADLTDILASHLPLSTDQKLELLAEPRADVRARLLVERWSPEGHDSDDIARYN